MRFSQNPYDRNHKVRTTQITTMARPVTTLVVFFVSFNLVAGLLSSMGIAAAFGINAEIGGDEAISDLRDSVDEVPTGTGAGETLFGLYNVLATFVNTVFTFILPAVAMLENAGLHSDIADSMRVLFVVLIAIDVVSFFKGWGL